MFLNQLIPSQVREVRFLLYSTCNQINGKTAEFKTIGEAVDDGIIANETLAYFLARTQMYMVKIGVDPTKLRFRQLKDSELANYACDCWDVECLTSQVFLIGLFMNCIEFQRGCKEAGVNNLRTGLFHRWHLEFAVILFA